MKAYVRHIGIIDIYGNTHGVSFTEGVNVVTGKSSTGKSAILDIFDYCLGSSIFTPPKHGVTAEYGSLYFVVINLERSSLLLARGKDLKKAFLKEDLDSKFELLEDITEDSFEDSGFLPINIFRKNLGRYFGLTLTTTEENNELRSFRTNQTKLPSPSVRSFSSFILQQQNLIANKFALFYRFEEKEKKDQAIEHFKYFAGFVTPEYYSLKQRENELNAKHRALLLSIKKITEQEENFENELKDLLRQYRAASGSELKIGNIHAITSNPHIALERLLITPVQTNSESEEYKKLRAAEERVLASQVASLRRSQNKLSDIRSSIRLTQDIYHPEHLKALPESLKIEENKCPFCNSQNPNILESANKLSDAIDWLNTKLKQSHYMRDSLEERKNEIIKEINGIKEKIKSTEDSIKKIDKDTEDIAKLKTQYEVSLKIKTRIEILLENAVDNERKRINEELVQINAEIKSIKKTLHEKFNLYEKKKEAEEFIKTTMNSIGVNFDFEEFYKPLNLHFSLDTFDLWHETEDGMRVLLRSMGSGANWLSSHLTLFLSLLKYFCSLKERCRIPTILLLDQPSQVYFPRTDYGDAFNAYELSEKSLESEAVLVDHNLQSVQNMYTQLVNFCEETTKETGITPQIIVADHADNLTLGSGFSFESLVRARWRTHSKGLVDLDKVTSSK